MNSHRYPGHGVCPRLLIHGGRACRRLLQNDPRSRPSIAPFDAIHGCRYWIVFGRERFLAEIAVDLTDLFKPFACNDWSVRP